MVNVIAHRGASRARRENTVEALRYAVELGTDGVELDVRRSRDGALVVHHDAHVEGVGPIAEVTAATLPAYVPLLAAALDACAGAFVNVEIKNNAKSKHYDAEMCIVHGVVEELRRRPDARFSVSSFDPATLDEVRRLQPELPTAVLFDRGDPTRQLRDAVRRGHHAVHPDDLLVDEVFMAQARQLGLDVNVWTVDDPQRMSELIGLGVAGIITNVPDVALLAVCQAFRDGAPGGEYES